MRVSHVRSMAGLNARRHPELVYALLIMAVAHFESRFGYKGINSQHKRRGKVCRTMFTSPIARPSPRRRS